MKTIWDPKLHKIRAHEVIQQTTISSPMNYHKRMARVTSMAKLINKKGVDFMKFNKKQKNLLKYFASVK